jgi:hypothetical protein
MQNGCTDTLYLCSGHKNKKIMELTKDNTLYLTIKQVYFDQIIAGTKKEEYREIKDTTYKKYLACDEEGNPYFDDEKISPDEPLTGDIFV